MRRTSLVVMTLVCLTALLILRPGVGLLALGLRPHPLSGKVVAVDPGHGGFDAGAYHKDSGIKEKDLTLDIALRLKEHLIRVGAVPLLTREIDEMKGDNYQQDLALRARLVNESEATVLVSIHVNEFPDPGCWGGQTFFAPQCPESKRLAHLVQEELIRLQPGNERLPAAMSYFMLTAVSVPAVLVEAGFITSPADRERLLQENYREQLALGLLKALGRYALGYVPGDLR